jgi:hypothetical protein
MDNQYTILLAFLFIGVLVYAYAYKDMIKFNFLEFLQKFKEK